MLLISANLGIINQDKSSAELSIPMLFAAPAVPGTHLLWLGLRQLMGLQLLGHAGNYQRLIYCREFLGLGFATWPNQSVAYRLSMIIHHDYPSFIPMIVAYTQDDFKILMHIDGKLWFSGLLERQKTRNPPPKKMATIFLQSWLEQAFYGWWHSMIFHAASPWYPHEISRCRKWARFLELSFSHLSLVLLLLHGLAKTWCFHGIILDTYLII